MRSAPILVLASCPERGRQIAGGETAGDPPLVFLSWEALEADPARLAVSAVVCEAGEELAARQGLLEILRRAYPAAPLVSFSPAGAPGAPPGPPSPAFDLHLQAPLSAANLRTLVSRETRLRRLARRHQQAIAQVRDQAEKLDLLVETAKAANSVLEPQLVMRVLMSRLQERIRADSWSLALVAEEGTTRWLDVVRGDRTGSLHTYRAGADSGLLGWVVRNRRPALVADAAADSRCETAGGPGPGHRSVLCVPLTSRGRVIGAVQLDGAEGEGEERFGEKELNLLRALMEPAAITIENAILFKKLEELSVTDDLTRLYNSRFLNSSLGREIKRARRYGQSVSVIFLDLDGFKTINDSWGHLAGSRTLAEVGQVLLRRVRESDVVARYGGDEFTIVMAQTGPAEAVVLAERLRQAIEEHVFLTAMGLEVRITASFGIASYPDHGETREDLISQADRAMYRVKERSKNGVELALAAEGSVALNP